MKKFLFTLLFLSFCIRIAAQDENTINRLQAMNSVGVTIGGNFIVTGTFPAFANERLDQFVTRIYNQARENILQVSNDPAMLRDFQKDFEKYSFRDITLKRVSGEELKIDLLKFRRTADYSQNPYLRQDDVIIFPFTDLERNFFTVTGAVMQPGKFHFTEGIVCRI
jgi:hypothetical protein